MGCRLPRRQMGGRRDGAWLTPGAKQVQGETQQKLGMETTTGRRGWLQPVQR